MFISEMDLNDAEVLNPTEGVVLGVIKKKSEEEANMEKFAKVSNGEKLKKPSIEYMEGLIPHIDENEFWGKDDGE